MHANVRSTFRWTFAALAVLGLVALTAHGQAPAGRPLIADVNFHGNRLVGTPQLMGIIRTRADTPYSAETLDEDVKRLMASRLVGNAWVTRRDTAEGKVVVTFNVVEPPNEIQEIEFLGAKHIKKDELLTLTEAQKALIHQTPDLSRVRQQGTQDGMRPLRLAGAMKVAEGLTTLEEVLRATPAWDR